MRVKKAAGCNDDTLLGTELLIENFPNTKKTFFFFFPRSDAIMAANTSEGTRTVEHEETHEECSGK